MSRSYSGTDPRLSDAGRRGNLIDESDPGISQCPVKKSDCTCRFLRPPPNPTGGYVAPVHIALPSVNRAGVRSLPFSARWLRLLPWDASPPPHGRRRTACGRCGTLLLDRNGLPPPTRAGLPALRQLPFHRFPSTLGGGSVGDGLALRSGRPTSATSGLTAPSPMPTVPTRSTHVAALTVPPAPPIFGPRFLAWWLGELAGFLPERLTGTIGPRHRLPDRKADRSWLGGGGRCQGSELGRLGRAKPAEAGRPTPAARDRPIP